MVGRDQIGEVVRTVEQIIQICGRPLWVQNAENRTRKQFVWGSFYVADFLLNEGKHVGSDGRICLLEVCLNLLVKWTLHFFLQLENLFLILLQFSESDLSILVPKARPHELFLIELHHSGAFDSGEGPSFSFAHEVEGAAVDASIVVDAHKAAYFEDSEVKKDQRIEIQHFPTQGSSLAEFTPSQLVFSGDLK